MNKYKISNTVAALLLVASFFAGWQAMLIVGALLFIFGDMGDKIRNLAVSLISFTIGIKLVQMLWGLIYDASRLIPSILEKLVGILNYYLDPGKQLSFYKLKLYVVNPIMDVFEIGNSVIGFLIALASFFFITSLLVGANKKGYVVDKYISGYVNKVVNFISQFGDNGAAATTNSNMNNNPTNGDV